MSFRKVLPIFFLFFSGFVFPATSVVDAVSGVLDLRGYNFNRMVLLGGEWEFHLTEVSGGAVEDSETRYLSVPGSWIEISGTQYAAGEYRLKILLPENHPEIGALIFPELSQIVAVELNGQELFSFGDFKTGETSYTRFLLPVNLSPEMDLTVRIKNTSFREGGLVYLPIFGPRKMIREFREKKIWIEAFFAGTLFLVSFYHIFLFFRDRRANSALFLGISALLFLVRGIVTGENTVTFLFQGFPWELDYRLEYITAYLNGMVLFLFCNRTFPFENRIINVLEKCIIVLMIFLSLLTAVLPIHLVSRTILVLSAALIFSFTAGLTVYFHALIGRKKNSALFFTGGIVLFTFFIFDSVYYLGGAPRLLNLSQLGMFLFVLIQTFVLSRLYGDAFVMAEEIGRTLEDEVLRRTLELEEANEKLQILSTTDPLTGAANRLKINLELEKSHQLYRRYGNSYGVIMFDLDLFKRVNDNYGHETGDLVLKEIVGIVRLLIRDTDIVSRWGGEEFVILLPFMDLEGTATAAERIRAAFECNDFPRVRKVTASFGVVVPVDKSESLDNLLVRLDEKLYKAKKEGRNRVIV